MAEVARLMTSYPEYPEALRSVETEAALLGALLIDNSFVDGVAERLQPEDFHEPLHQRIFSAILSEVSAGRRADAFLLRGHFVGDPAFAELGPGYLFQLTSSSASLIGVWDFTRAIADLAKRRRLLDEMRALTENVSMLSEHPVERLVEDMDTALANALQRSTVTQSASITQAFDKTLQAIEDEAAGLGPRGIMAAGFDDWNHLTGGMRRGEMIVLGGRPSMGKTATAISLALAVARAGHGVLFVSLEMSIAELTTRAISDLCFRGHGSPAFNDIRRGNINQFDRERIREARTMIESWGMVLTDPPALRIGRLAMMIRRYQRQMVAAGQSLDVVFVDYLGLIRGDDRKAKRYEEVSEISRAVKRIAKECNVAIVILAQLNREVEKREDKRPMMSDLRDSGDIEQDADVVAFVYREEYYLERSEPPSGDKKHDGWQESMNIARNRVEIIAAKVRNGQIGKRNCYFFGANQAVRGSRFYADGDHL